MTDTPSRKLAVIMHADVVGSTTLVQKDESLAHERIRTAFQWLSKTASDYGGIAHEIRGDALVAEFSRASDAVCAALAFQAKNTERNATLDDEIRPEVRIGVSLGEVVVADGTLTGAGVVLAQRLEQLAEPDGVVVQVSVSETVPMRLPFVFESLGEQSLKGFDQPVRACIARQKPGTVTPAPESTISNTKSTSAFADDTNSAATAQTEKPSIAVLPFVNATGDPNEAYFADGIGYGLVTELSRNRSLTVKSAIWSSQLDSDRLVVGKEFDVNYVLEGSVQKAGKRVRITVQLIDARTGATQWADQLDRTGDDVLALQDDIARTVAATLFGYRGRIQELEMERAIRKPTVSATAYDLFLLATWHKRRYTKEDNAKAMEYLGKAIELDPNYSDAFTWLSFAHGMQMYYTSDDLAVHSARAVETAKKAITFDRQSDIAYAALGSAYVANRQYDLAIEAYDKSLTLNPNSADTLALKAHAMSYNGQGDESVALIELAKQINPHYPEFYDWGLGIACFLAKRYEDAVAAFNRLTEQNADSATWLAASLSQLQRRQQAEAAVTLLLELKPDFKLSTSTAVENLSNASDRDHLFEALRALGLPD